jgi:hypothetical protein
VDIPDEVYAALAETYTDEGCRIWWTGYNKRLRGTPAIMWWNGRRAEVEAAAESLLGRIAT